jgi:hypothetical protein
MMGVHQLIAALQALVPAPVVWALVAVAVILAAPSWFRGVRARQIRGALRRAARAPDPTVRGREEEAAYQLAGERDLLWVVVADTAVRQGQWVVARRALEVLELRGKVPRDIARIRADLGRPPPSTRDVGATIVHVEALLSERLWARAEATLAEAHRRFPNHPELLALSARLESSCPKTPSDASSTTSSANSI